MARRRPAEEPEVALAKRTVGRRDEGVRSLAKGEGLGVQEADDADDAGWRSLGVLEREGEDMVAEEVFRAGV